jgi:hypothetical protein
MLSNFVESEDQAYLQANMPLTGEGYDYQAFSTQLFSR